MSKTNNCIECAQRIPDGARKCHKCGSFQDWRRYVYFGQISVALVFSIAALVSSAVAISSAFFQNIIFGVSNEAELTTAVVDIDKNLVKFIVTNRYTGTIAINYISCGIFLPTNEFEFRYNDWPKKSEAIGEFLLRFTAVEDVVIPGKGQATFSAVRTHITPPKPGLSSLDEPAVSYCFVRGVSDRNEVTVSLGLLRPSDLINFSVMEFLEIADFSEVQEAERQLLLDVIRPSKGDSLKNSSE